MKKREKLGIGISTILVVLLIIVICFTKENKTTIKWLVSEMNLDEDIGIYKNKNYDNINQYLEKLGKSYEVETIAYPDDATWEEIKKIAEVEEVDIISLSGIDSYNNTPDAMILQAIREGCCKEVQSDYPNSERLTYQGKLYGYGNITIAGSNGISYSERFLKETGLTTEELSGRFQMNSFSEQFKENHKGYVFHAGWPQADTTLLVIGDLFYVEPETGVCGYVYDHPEVQAVLLENQELIQAGYARNPESFSSTRSEDPDVIIGANHMYYEQAGTLVYDISSGENKVFIKDAYTYYANNVLGIENIIWKDSKYEEEATDFLELLYTDKILCNRIVYGMENPDFSEIDTPKEYYSNPVWNTNLCNENLIDEAGGWTAQRKEEAYAEYQQQYKNSKIEGFLFELPEDLEETYGQVQSVLMTGNEFSKIRNKTGSWESAWENIKAQVQEAGSDQILEELKVQVGNYIK